MLDVSSIFTKVWDAIAALRSDVTYLKQQERPAASSGSAASRPATGLVGERYFSTDTGVDQYWNGSAWVVLGGGGTSPDASTTVKGITKLSVAPVSSTSPIAVGDNDSRMTNSRTPSGAASGDFTGFYPGPTLAQDRVNLQATSPGTQQTGNANLSGTINAGTTYYKAGVEWMGSGTSFPLTPATYQRFFRTDRLIEYYYDGTRWLSDIKYLTVATSGELIVFSQATHNFVQSLAGVTSNGIYLASVDASFYSATAQSTSNYYTFSIANLNVGFLTLTGTTDTKTFTTGNTWNKMLVGFSSPALTSTAFGLQFVMTPTGTPGTFNFYITLGFRLIG